MKQIGQTLLLLLTISLSLQAQTNVPKQKIKLRTLSPTMSDVASLVIAVVALAFIGARDTAGESKPVRPMNVLFLVSDDLNSWLLGDTNRYAGKVVAPNLTRLAESGVNFERAYTAAPVCSPSRTAFFSGVAPWRSGHYHNTPGASISKPLNNALSLAGAFKKAGYTTMGYGKITHGWDQRENWDEKIGHRRDPAPPGAPLTSVGRGEQDWGPIYLSEEEMNSTQLANRTIEQLGKKHDRPFFLACGFFNPHMPWYVPQKYFDMFPLDDVTTPAILTNDLADVPAAGVKLTGRKGKYVDAIMEAGLHKEGVRAYLATTAYVDFQMGRILDALEKSAYTDDTIVVFLTDHGFHLGEKHHWQKATLWEEATHCLLMFRVPGLTPAGGVSQRFVSLQDIYPTLVDLCGLDRPNYLDGRSLMPLLKSPTAAWQSTAVTCLTDKGTPEKGYVTIRNELGRYIRYAEGQEEFYDTQEDPHEWTNEINSSEHAEVVKKLKAAVPAASDMAIPLPCLMDQNDFQMQSFACIPVDNLESSLAQLDHFHSSIIGCRFQRMSLLLCRPGSSFVEPLQNHLPSLTICNAPVSKGVLVCAAIGIDPIHFGARLANYYPDIAEAADRLRTRNDIDWQDLRIRGQSNTSMAPTPVKSESRVEDQPTLKRVAYVKHEAAQLNDGGYVIRTRLDYHRNTSSAHAVTID